MLNEELHGLRDLWVAPLSDDAVDGGPDPARDPNVEELLWLYRAQPEETRALFVTVVRSAAAVVSACL